MMAEADGELGVGEHTSLPPPPPEPADGID